jgi:ABC-type oligopeptide transport system substrate-binding subunit
MSQKPNYFSAYLGGIVGSKTLMGKKFQTGISKGIKKLSELKLEVELDFPNPSFLQTLTDPYFSLVPMEELQSDYFSWKKWTIGAGSYKVISFNPTIGKIELALVNSSVQAPPLVHFFVKETPSDLTSVCPKTEPL